MLLGVVYRPLAVGKLDIIESVLSDCIPDHEHVTLMGDFIVDLLKETNESQHGQTTVSGLSYHDIVYVSYCLRVNKFIPKILTYRNLNNLDVNYYRDATETKWHEIFTLQNLDDELSLFNNKLISLYDKHIPVVKKRITHPPAPLDETRNTSLDATS
ncbi:hypothetical protein PR048_016667 [Dryococelus australis]|uniref:Uncharacterized protein n=1 Tax=Dryococelus australis TaxID=614101 RepID=A0ABQ9H7C6_9NEOP|nr:hypothetical protein PR048_016667 [Dryococelus australis]